MPTKKPQPKREVKLCSRGHIVDCVCNMDKAGATKAYLYCKRCMKVLDLERHAE
jgi:hypothetical protein